MLTRTFPALETDRFRLRQMKEGDAPRVFDYFSKDEVTRYYDLESFHEEKQALEIIEKWNERFHLNEGIRWGIALKESNEIIGSCGFHQWEKEHFKAEVGFEVHPSYWRQGVITEVLQPILRYGFEEMNLNRIEAYYDPENMPSKRSLEKSGFTFEGVLRKAAFEKGVFCDAAVCSLLKEEY
ncbi:GNAT family N-acetyltransferase [Rossellomorea vietnamensis]|uniref:GNAT family N-acetyltransferase n=1 Tax=Rossellomorea vietnamensis TaxID=218284 RepID=UPI001CCF9C89|nr:GNAT family N-acetyltransferase [Rossellomorea vietnamensis]MCA0150072.1 GNAT family N-acetyltransferase [Rossellomorea vietnamensis]